MSDDPLLHELCFEQIEPFSYMDKVHCAVCGLVFAGDNETSPKVAAYLHVTRCHPREYEEAVGHPPEPGQIKETVYALLEGLIESTEVGGD